MWKNYFKLAWRNILANKLRTGIHILGLAIGVTVCFVIFNVISFSYSFDQFHRNKEETFQVTTLTSYKDQSWPNSGVPFPLGDAVKEELTGVADVAHFYTLYNTLISLPTEEKHFERSHNVIFTDPGFFRLFERDWLAGNPNTALKEPNAVVLTEASLKKYFPGREAPEVLGKELLYVNRDSMLIHVTGVVGDYTENTDFTFTDFISKSTLPTLENIGRSEIENWQSVNSSSQLFVLLEDSRLYEEIEAGLSKIVDKYIPKEEGRKTEFFVQPLSELHFSQTYATQRGDKSVLNGLMIIGVILLLMACMNFINLETAQAIYRSREVGIRKTLGSSTGQLMFQFLVETFVFVWLSMALSFFLTEMTAHYFREYLPEGMDIDFLTFENMAFLFGLSLVLTLLSGFYPAFILGKYQPSQVMKANAVGGRKFSFGFFLRKNLLVIQFTFSIVFIIGIMTINKQMKFLAAQEMGFDRELVMYAHTPFLDSLNRNYNANIKNHLEQQSFVQGVSLSSDMVASSGLWTSLIEYQDKNGKQEYEVQVKKIDKDFLKVNGLKLLAGR